MSEPRGVFSTNFRVQYDCRVSVPAVFSSFVSLGSVFNLLRPFFSLSLTVR